MNLKTYTLSVSLAAVIGLLLTSAPFVRSVLEYRAPEPVKTTSERTELSSLDNFILANITGQEKQRFLAIGREGVDGRVDWQTMYDAAQAQQAEAVRGLIESVHRKAGQNVIAYGTLCALSVLLLITHLLWAKRLAS